MTYTRRPFTFDRVARIFFTIICIAVALWVINYLRGVLLPFLVACLLAYILDPIVEFNRRLLHLKHRGFASILTLVIVFGVITAACWVLFPYLVSETADMIDLLKRYSESNFDVPYLSPEIHKFIKSHIDINYLSSLMSREEWLNLLKKTAGETWTFVGSTVSVLLTIVSWLIVLLYLVFILIDYDKVMGGFKRAVPVRYRPTAYKIIRDIQDSMNHYFRGQALVSLIVGILFSIGFVILDIPLGIVLGMSIGVLNMVPYLQLISIPVAALLCLVSSVATGSHFWVIFAEVIALYCIVQLIQDLLLTPKIMGKYMGLNPAIIFLSLSVWATLLGFIGLIIALPLTSLIIAYYNEYVLHEPSADSVDTPQGTTLPPPGNTTGDKES